MKTSFSTRLSKLENLIREKSLSARLQQKLRETFKEKGLTTTNEKWVECAKKM